MTASPLAPALYPIRESIFPRPRGWLIIGWPLVALGILHWSLFGLRVLASTAGLLTQGLR